MAQCFDNAGRLLAQPHSARGIEIASANPKHDIVIGDFLRLPSLILIKTCDI